MTQVSSTFITAPSMRPSSSYSPVAITLHWIMAALILYAGIHGLLLDGWAKETKLFWINIHALVGLSVLALLLVRMWWRWNHAPPELPADVSEFSRRVSHPAHLLIYALMFVTPIVGIVAFVWHGRVLNFGLFTLDLGVKSNGPVYHQAEDIHLWLTYGLFALIAGHAVAALWHHFIDRDTVLTRMLPGLSPPQAKRPQ
ncbi:MAG TPA: cytochrome b [Xanthobacteraceae bacterium]|jgi:cytochrome b561